jgi:hypothetical protein
MQYILEEAELMKLSNRQEPQQEISETASLPEPEASQPETKEQEPTAVVSTKPDIIEGEVIVLDPPEPSDVPIPPKQKPYWLLIPLAFTLCLSFLGVSYLLPLFSPSATVTIIPVERTITTTTAVQVQGRSLAPLTLSQSQTMQATGHRHQNATSAYGTITFYNGLLTSQTIAAGTVLTGNEGVQVITDQGALIPAGNPPSYGQVSVSAHAVLAGVQGNIPAYDINTACCATSVVAKNTEAFTGAQSARNVLIVTRTDINTAATSLLALLGQSEVAALQAQLHSGEALVNTSCTPHVSSDHKPGDEAITVTVTASETCGGIAYAAHTLYTNATQLIPSQANKMLGTNYRLIGDIQVTIVHATVPYNRQGQAHMLVQVTGTWVYQITAEIQQHLIKLITGKTKQQAIATLLTFSGIAGAQITVKGENQTLPQDPKDILIIVQYRAS